MSRELSGRDHELHLRRRGRNWGVFGGLLALAVLLFAVTIVKLGPEARNPSAEGSWGEALVEWLRG
jgi:hypothetical protein